MLASVKPVLYFEIWEFMAHYGTDLVSLGDTLKSIGYRFFRNIGQRNSSNDGFIVSELESLPPAKGVWDCLAIDRDGDRIASLVSSS
jgi:hypothetical protein